MSSREKELRHYWDASRALHAARRGGYSPALVAEWCDEIEVLADYTDWPLLRLACVQTLGVVRAEMYDRAANG